MTSFAFDKLTELYNSYEDNERPISVIARKDGRQYSPSTARDQMDIYTNAHKDVSDVTIASLRHSFASAAIRSGTDINDICRRNYFVG